MLLDPLLVVRNVDIVLRMEDQAAEVPKLINVGEEIAEVVGDALELRIEGLQVLLVKLTDPFHSQRDALVVDIASRLLALVELHKQDGVPPARSCWIPALQ
eukprot:TRINITY_DN12544_c0_g1_i2.p1 TRINITY_DN12544_c0_g1~~TRINITY_DN12544_c0_g1_i2.p1  ORF type:complete len:101 (-),score=11.68 TRINITY_DN12544_c0_g1_i2:251-553(-)